MMCLLWEVSSASGRAPNIVLLLADDMGYGDASCYGATDCKTPNIDRLAREGVRFTQYYANGAECTPTRTALLTGAYQQRVGGLECAIGTHNVGRYDDAIRLAAAHDLGLPPDRAVLPAPLKKSGYATALIGKWHLGYERKFNPLNYGFDRFFGILGGNADYWQHTEADGYQVLYENRKPAERDGYMTHLITDEAIEFVKANRDRPFFLFVSHTAPHTPLQDPLKKPGQIVSEDKWNEGTRADYVRVVEDMDDQIGRLLDLLDDLKLAQDTLVLFASDHGAPQPGRNAPFRGHKGGTFEGGLRAPLVVRWPGKIKPKTEWHQPAVTLDLTKSILRIAAAEPPQSAKLDGLDVLDHVQRGQPTPRRPLFWRARRGERTWRAVRDGDLKYVSRTDDGKTEQWLFDLKADPAEERNLFSSRAKDAGRLRQLLAGWEKQVQHSR